MRRVLLLWRVVSATVVALIALGVAAAALAVTAAMYLKLRRVRGAQTVLLGGGKEDVVDFAISLQGRIDDLHRAVDEVATGLSRVDRRVDACVSKTSIVRYDAYEGAGGHQSASLAFLDSARSGVVVGAIQGRDYARIYVKELDRGKAPIALSPEGSRRSSARWPRSASEVTGRARRSPGTRRSCSHAASRR